MSILINMEMPKNCGDCKAFVCYRQWAGDVGDCFCGITKNDAEAKKKNADCPLVLVPPHGRLVDMDEIEERIDSCCDDIDCSKTMCNECAVQIVMDKVFDAPTVIPAEEEQL